MKHIIKSAFVIARASNANPAVGTATVMFFWLMINMLFMVVETLVFGERFEHWGDVVLALSAIGYAGLCVECCSVVQEDDKAAEIALNVKRGES